MGRIRKWIKGKYVDQNREIRVFRLVVTVIVVALLICVTLWVLIGSFVSIPAGYKGVIVASPSGPSTEELDEGWHWNAIYLFSQIEKIRYNTQTMDMSYSEGGTLTVRSSDNLNIQMDISVIYHLPADKVADVRIALGDYHDVLGRYLRSTPRNVASNYTGEFIGGDGRIIVEDHIRFQLTSDLAPYNIIVEDVRLRSIDLPFAVDQAIEAKKSAEQAIITAQYLKEALIIRAEANRSAAIINAEGFRNATVIKANGTMEAMRMIVEEMQRLDPSLTNATYAYLTMLFIQALTDPNSNVEFLIITSGGIPIIIQP